MRRPNVVRNTVPSARSLRYFPHVPFHTHTQLRVCIVTYCRKGNTQKKGRQKNRREREREGNVHQLKHTDNSRVYTHTHNSFSSSLCVCVHLQSSSKRTSWYSAPIYHRRTVERDFDAVDCTTFRTKLNVYLFKCKKKEGVKHDAPQHLQDVARAS